MKKILCLALSLVMAMSLATVAWGITDKNTLVDDDSDGVITLTSDLTVTFAGEHVPALANGTVINGNGHTLTLNGNIGSYDTWAAITGKNLTINNLVVVNNLTSARAVFVLEGGALNNVDVSGAGVVVHPAGTAAITLTDCDFTGFSSVAILTDDSEDAPINMVRCTFDGDSYAIIVRNDDGSAVGCTFDGKVNLYAEDSAAGFTGNTFNERVKLYNDDEVLAGNSFGTNGVIALDTGVTSVDASGNYWGGSAPTDTQLGGATATTYATTVANDGTVGDLYYSSTNTPVNPPAPSVPVYPYYPPVVEDTTDTKVDSAQTFDAGIALYVGVSVLGAMGTVALGKKRED